MAPFLPHFRQRLFSVVRRSVVGPKRRPAKSHFWSRRPAHHRRLSLRCYRACRKSGNGRASQTERPDREHLRPPNPLITAPHHRTRHVGLRRRFRHTQLERSRKRIHGVQDIDRLGTFQATVLRHVSSSVCLVQGGGLLLLPADRAQLQCFVGDRVTAIRGTERTRKQVAWHSPSPLLPWTLLGFRFHWRKGDKGRCIVWIGTKFTIGVPPVTVDYHHLLGVSSHGTRTERLDGLDGLVGRSSTRKGLMSVTEVQKPSVRNFRCVQIPQSCQRVFVECLVEHHKTFEQRSATTSAKKRRDHKLHAGVPGDPALQAVWEGTSFHDSSKYKNLVDTTFHN